MSKLFTIIDKEKNQQDRNEIEELIAQIKNQLILMTSMQEILIYYQRSKFNKLEDMLIKMQKQGCVIDMYREECVEITHLYANHILSTQLKQNPPTLMAMQTFFQYLKETEFFNYPKIFYQVSFRLLAKRFYGEQDFTIVSKQDKVNDKCVGCNSWFYKYHMIEAFFNQKSIPVHFMYNISKQYAALKNQNLIKNPSRELMIDLKDFSSYEKILLNKILDILNEGGGYLTIGCQKMQHLKRDKFLPYQAFVQNPQLNQIHFVIGQNLNQLDKNKLQDNIQKLIKPICPLVSLHLQIKIRYLPVILSKYEHNVELSQIYGSHVEGRYVILIAIRPNSGKYSLKKQYKHQESRPFQNFEQAPRPKQRYVGIEVEEEKPEYFEWLDSQQQHRNESVPFNPQPKQILNELCGDIQKMFNQQRVFGQHKCQYSQS